MDRLQVRLAALSMAIDVYKSAEDAIFRIDDTMEYANIFNDFLLEDIVAFEKEQAEISGDVIPVDFGKGEVIDEATSEED